MTDWEKVRLQSEQVRRANEEEEEAQRLEHELNIQRAIERARTRLDPPDLPLHKRIPRYFPGVEK